MIEKTRILKRRGGFTLIEVLVTIVVMAIAALGFGKLLYDAAEAMHISWQIREIEEYGNNYCVSFSKYMRNAKDVKLTIILPPSELKLTYYDPYDRNARVSAKMKEIRFMYYNKEGIPVIKENDQIKDYVMMSPFKDKPDSRDQIEFVRESFLIKERHVDPNKTLGYVSTGRGTDDDDNKGEARKAYYTLQFTAIYQRLSGIRQRAVFEKELFFKTSAYPYNGHWPHEEQKSFALHEEGTDS